MGIVKVKKKMLFFSAGPRQCQSQGQGAEGATPLPDGSPAEDIMTPGIYLPIAENCY